MIHVCTGGGGSPLSRLLSPLVYLKKVRNIKLGSLPIFYVFIRKEVNNGDLPDKTCTPI